MLSGSLSFVHLFAASTYMWILSLQLVSLLVVVLLVLLEVLLVLTQICGKRSTMLAVIIQAHQCSAKSMLIVKSLICVL
jgi:hypothetical protein